MAVTVKVCGFKNADDIALALEAGADYGGLVLAESLRQVSLAEAEVLTASFPGRLVAVVKGVSDRDWALLWDMPWGGLQVYDRPQTAWVPDAQRRGWLTVQPGPGEATRGAAAVLLLEGRPGRGERLSWESIQRPREPFWLAGGLGPDNVGRALEVLRPQGVDVSSGVEKSPGVKDIGLVREFIKEVRQWQG
jgi:phosphoribosylanthranilate isomerase